MPLIQQRFRIFLLEIDIGGLENTLARAALAATALIMKLKCELNKNRTLSRNCLSKLNHHLDVVQLVFRKNVSTIAVADENTRAAGLIFTFS